MSIYKSKVTKKFYIITKQCDDKYVLAINIEDKYTYSIPIEDLELWLELIDPLDSMKKEIEDIIHEEYIPCTGGYVVRSLSADAVLKIIDKYGKEFR